MTALFTSPLPFEISKNEPKHSYVLPADFGLSPECAPLIPFDEPHFGSAIRGFGGEFKIVRAAPFRSILASDLRSQFDADPRVHSFAAYSHELHFFVPRTKGGLKRMTFTPATTVRYRNADGGPGRIEVVAVKNDELQLRKAWRVCEPYIREAYRLDHGVDFYVVGETVGQKEPRLENCKIMNSHRWRSWSDDEARRRVGDVVRRAVLPISIGEIIDRAALPSPPGRSRGFTALMNLLLEGEVAIDQSVPLTARSLLYRSALP